VAGGARKLSAGGGSQGKQRGLSPLKTKGGSWAWKGGRGEEGTIPSRIWILDTISSSGHRKKGSKIRPRRRRGGGAKGEKEGVGLAFQKKLKLIVLFRLFDKKKYARDREREGSFTKRGEDPYQLGEIRKASLTTS